MRVWTGVDILEKAPVLQNDTWIICGFAKNNYNNKYVIIKNIFFVLPDASR